MRSLFLLFGFALALPAAPLFVGATLGAANDYVLLALPDGTMTINSATSITGNVGYSSGVVSETNQKVDLFTGTALVHSTATFDYAAATFIPSGGIVVGGPADALLAQAALDAVAAAVAFGSLPGGVPLGAVSSDLNLTATGDVNVYDVTSISFNENTLTLNGDSDDAFIFRVTGDMDWAKSTTVLNGVSSGQVIFYFPNAASAIVINKAETVFYGTILAPFVTDEVIYHNPAFFEGAIIAKGIDVHSSFNIVNDEDPVSDVPEPGSFAILGLGMAGIAMRRWVRR